MNHGLENIISFSGQVVLQYTCSCCYIFSHVRCKKELTLVYSPSLSENARWILDHPSCSAQVLIINHFFINQFPSIWSQKGPHHVCLPQECLIPTDTKGKTRPSLPMGRFDGAWRSSNILVIFLLNAVVLKILQLLLEV